MDYVGGPFYVDSSDDRLAYLNTAAFAQVPIIPASGASAPSRHPGKKRRAASRFWNLDLAFSKTIVITGGVRLQVRGDLFNAFNSTSFSAVNTTITSPNFGRFTSARRARRTAQHEVDLVTPIGMIGPGVDGQRAGGASAGACSRAPRSRGVAISTTAPSSMSSSPLAATAVRHESHARHTTRIVFFFLTEARPSCAWSPALQRPARIVVLCAAFGALLFDGFELGLMPLASLSSVSRDLLGDRYTPTLGGDWFARFGLLFGAAIGGILLGSLGIESAVRAIGHQHSVLFGVCRIGGMVQTQEQMLVPAVMVGLGVGGVVAQRGRARGRMLARQGPAGGGRRDGGGDQCRHPDAVATPRSSRSLTADSWRWLFTIAAVPAALGLLVWFFLPNRRPGSPLADVKPATDAPRPCVCCSARRC